MTAPTADIYSVAAMSGLQHAYAFVVQFRATGDPATGELSGRVEHVASGRMANFDCLEDVPELLLCMMKAWHEDQNKT